MASEALPLFALQTVLFPGGLLTLKVFEARYLDMVARCLREGRGFGVVALRRGAEVRGPEAAPVELEACGTLAELLDVDAGEAGILHLRCRGARRFELHASHQQADGLWVGEAGWLDDDPVLPPGAAFAASVRGLEQAVDGLAAQGAAPFLEPYRFDDAGWVANRWCEILPLPLGARLRLMRLPDPLLRLELVDGFLRDQGVIG